LVYPLRLPNRKEMRGYDHDGSVRFPDRVEAAWRKRQ
jgi:hypothetical protein